MINEFGVDQRSSIVHNSHAKKMKPIIIGVVVFDELGIFLF